LTRVCLALYVALSGFDYPLSGFLLRVLGIPISGPSVPGVTPFRVLFPLWSWAPFRGPLLSCPFFVGVRPKTANDRDFRALFPTASLPRAGGYYTDDGVAALLGFFIFEALLFQPCRPKTAPLLHLRPVSDDTSAVL
jgi:hypothetical protein